MRAYSDGDYTSAPGHQSSVRHRLFALVTAVLLLSGLLVASSPTPATAGVVVEQTWSVRGLADSQINISWRVRDLAHIGNRQFAAGRFTGSGSG